MGCFISLHELRFVRAIFMWNQSLVTVASKRENLSIYLVDHALPFAMMRLMSGFFCFLQGREKKEEKKRRSPLEERAFAAIRAATGTDDTRSTEALVQGMVIMMDGMQKQIDALRAQVSILSTATASGQSYVQDHLSLLERWTKEIKAHVEWPTPASTPAARTAAGAAEDQAKPKPVSVQEWREEVGDIERCSRKILRLQAAIHKEAETMSTDGKIAVEHAKTTLVAARDDFKNSLEHLSGFVKQAQNVRAHYVKDTIITLGLKNASAAAGGLAPLVEGAGGIEELVASMDGWGCYDMIFTYNVL